MDSFFWPATYGALYKSVFIISIYSKYIILAFYSSPFGSWIFVKYYPLAVPLSPLNSRIEAAHCFCPVFPKSITNNQPKIQEI